ncbi:hypothetical protein D9M70_636600 [compost metagenome]
MQRIGEALVVAFADEAPADRTLEIADAAPARSSLLRSAMGEVATASLTTWVATAGWSGSLLRDISPRAANVSRRLLKPWCVPAIMLRRRLAARLNCLTVNQTYPKPD